MMIRPFVLAGLTACVLIAIYGHNHGDGAEGDNGEEFVWRGEVPAGHWIHIRNTNGPVRIDSTGGSTVEVLATKHWERGKPRDVRFKVTEEGNDVYVCALWGTRGRCGEHGYSASSPWWRKISFFKRSDVRVNFTVRVPNGVKVNASTVNGAIAVRGAGDEVEVETVNGGIEATTTRGPIQAQTVNGSIVARMDSLAGEGDIQLETVNGSITAYVPSAFDAELEAETVNGRVTSDFPITTSGEITPKQLHGVIGRGGRSISLETVNGSVRLLRGM
ncbi:MAG TPA: DUF4097 family beta strand repeat-containing protein [Gemmatimonadaceae bacterium]|nr:DUF4097 family beta strand repeat-containing protein [Gemmatimonadaceae bacterium]